MEHTPLNDLSRKLEEASKKVPVGKLVTHYKDPKQTYRVLDLVIDEDTEDVRVIYQIQHPLNPVTFDRPLYGKSGWLTEVEVEGTLIPRFRIFHP